MATILVIEDEETIRENLIELLEVEDFETLGAENGRQGVQLAKAQLPDLILCDVMMPELDGRGVLKALRSEPMTATIPFIFLTAKADRVDIREGMELGADDYLTKPCTSDELLRAINTRLQKHQVIRQKAQEQLDELRTNLTRSLPHELRTPLNGIIGFSDLILVEYDNLEREELLEMVEHIHASGHRLYRVIFNFLIYAEIEIASSNPEQLNQMRKVQISCCKSSLTEQTRKQALQVKRLEDVQIQLQESAVAIHAERLEKILEELLDNAFKFSSPGSPVEVKSEIQRDTFILSVKDQGRGMTPEQISEVGAYMQFERRLYEQQGMGLGLAIVKRLADLYWGKVHIESQPNQFTCVRVYFPISPGQEI